MTAQHTPGPWKHRNGRIFQLDREELTIANVARAFDGDYSPTNGDLIAAAPDLLEALLTARDHIDMDALEVSHCKDAQRIREAIAKATGQ